MISCFRVRALAFGSAALVATLSMGSQEPTHGRKYKAPPATAHVVITVEKGFNSKPLANAAVVFHAVRDGHDDGNLEIKTDPDGRATIDVLEVGSHVTLQVIASGFATYATDFDLTADSKEMLVKLERPRGQVSVYRDDSGGPAQVKPGIQEHVVTPPPAAAPTQPLTTTPVAKTPTTNTPSADAPSGTTTPK